jgi:hypothetical protein
MRVAPVVGQQKRKEVADGVSNTQRHNSPPLSRPSLLLCPCRSGKWVYASPIILARHTAPARTNAPLLRRLLNSQHSRSFSQRHRLLFRTNLIQNRLSVLVSCFPDSSTVDCRRRPGLSPFINIIYFIAGTVIDDVLQEPSTLERTTCQTPSVIVASLFAGTRSRKTSLG